LKERRQATYDPDHWLLGNILIDLGRALEGQGQHKDAEAALREAMDIYRDPALQNAAYWYAWAECWYGASLMGQGRNRFREAEERLLDAERRLRETPRTPPLQRRQAAKHLVRLYQAMHQPEKAARWQQSLVTPIR
jgi:hypothetical protein